MASDVIPGPTVEAAGLDVGDVIGDQVIAEGIAFIGGAPDFAGGGIDSDARRVADAGCVDAGEFAVGGVFEDVGAVEFAGVAVGIADVGAGADGDEQALAVEGEGEVAGGMASGGKVRDYFFYRSGSLHVAVT